MNIRIATNFDTQLFSSLFGEDVKLINLDDTEPIDLLIFPGGEDVALDFYLNGEELETFKDKCHINRRRDDIEQRILYRAMSNRIKVNKILGVCRGLQFLNVMFGGKLFPDLAYYGITHTSIHKLSHHTNTNVRFFKNVNSLHHQGIRTIGNNLYNLGIDTTINYTPIATDSGGDVYEIVSWESDRILGLQFHPEYYDEKNPDRIKFSEFIKAWIAGKTTILKG